MICAAIRGGIHVAGVAQRVVEVGGNFINPLGVDMPVMAPGGCLDGAEDGPTIWDVTVELPFHASPRPLSGAEEENVMCTAADHVKESGYSWVAYAGKVVACELRVVVGG